MAVQTMRTGRVLVRLPSSDINLDQSLEIVKNILNRAGHPMCFSGIDINFVNEVEFAIRPETNEVIGLSEATR